MNHRIRLSQLCWLFVIFWAAPVKADIARPCDVCPVGCGFSSIQAAIDAATDGDVIAVCAGDCIYDWVRLNLSR